MIKERYSKPVSCIYEITCKNYIYIGSTIIFTKRKFEHLWKLRKKIHPNLTLQNIYNKYGENKIKFSIIENVPSEKLIEIEQKYIDTYKGDKKKKLINVLMVAGNSLGYKQSQNTCNKKRISMLGKNKGQKRSVEFSKNQSIRQQHRIITKEWRDKISTTLEGRPSPNKPKKFVIYDGKTYSYKEFSEIKNCDLSTLYVTKREYTERKYGCKLI